MLRPSVCVEIMHGELKFYLETDSRVLSNLKPHLRCTVCCGNFTREKFVSDTLFFASELKPIVGLENTNTSM